MSRIIFALKWTAAVLCVAYIGCSAPEMKGTPFFTGEFSKPQGAPEGRINLWPLLYYHDPALSVLWPIGEVTDDHIALRPLCSVYKLDHERRQYNVLWPLSQFDFDSRDYRIFPFFWGAVSTAHTEKPGNEGRYFVVFPLGWYNSEQAYAALLPFLLHYWKPGGDDRSWHVLWPLFHYKDGWGEKGGRFWPLYGEYSTTVSRYQYLLWPLYHEFRSPQDERVKRIVFPLYWSEHGKQQGYSLFAPLLWHSYAPDESLLLSPLYLAHRRGEDQWHAVLPFFFSGRWGDESAFVTPFCGWLEGPESHTRLLPLLLSGSRRKNQERAMWILAPLTYFSWGGATPQAYVFPLFYCDGAGDFFTVLFGRRRRDEGGFWYAGGPLLVHRWQTDKGDGGSSESNFLWPFTGIYRDGKTVESWVWPLYRYQHQAEARQHSGYFLWPLVHYTYAPASRNLLVLPLFFSQHITSSDYRKVESLTNDSRTVAVAPSLWWSRSETHESDAAEKPTGLVRSERSNGFWPLWKWSDVQDFDTQKAEREFWILGWLYDYERKRAPAGEGEFSEYVRSRILWRAMHYERRDGESTLDVFPFSTWDRKANGFRKVSFAWRFFRYERDEQGGVELDVFFIPLHRTKAEKTPSSE